jgi:predicted DNA-binding transcriptional regulator AlpA
MQKTASASSKHTTATRPKRRPETGAPRSRKTPDQPLTIVQVPGALMMPSVTSAVTGLSISTLYRKVSAGQFPAPVRLGARCTRWKADDVRAWLKAAA